MKIIMPASLNLGSILSSNVPFPSASDPALWDPSEEYKAEKLCRIDTIIYEAQKANAGINPVTDTDDNWLQAGYVNKYALIDGFIGSKTTAVVEENGVWKIECHVDLGPSVVDAIGLFGLEGTTLTVRQYSFTSGSLVSENVINLQDETRVVDCYTYFFEPFYFKADVVIPLALFRSRVSIIVERNDAPARIGAISAGRTISLGMTRNGLEHGITNYSRRSTTLLGYEYFKKGRVARRKKFDVSCSSDDQDRVDQIMTELADKPAIYMAAGFFESNIVYGFCRYFSFYYSTSDLAYFSIDVESLI